MYITIKTILFLLPMYQLKSDLRKNKLSYLWLLIEPIIFFSTYYLVFKIIHFHHENPYIHVFLGLLVWSLFSKSVFMAVNIMQVSKNLIMSYHFNTFFLLLSRTIYSLLKNSILFLFLLIYLFCLHQFLISQLLFLIFLFILIVINTFCFSLIFSIASVLINDVRNIIGSLLTVFMFVSGVFFDPNKFSNEVLNYFMFNPIYLLIANLRSVVLDNKFYALEYLIPVSVATIIILVIGYFHYDRFIRLNIAHVE